jgi:hypothetical protein
MATFSWVKEEIMTGGWTEKKRDKRLIVVESKK